MEANSQNCNIVCLYSQIEEAYGKVVYSYTTQIIHAGRLYKKNNIMKWTQLALSALSTTGFVGTLVSDCIYISWIGGFISVALLVLTAYFKDKEFSLLYKKHLDVANDLWLIRERYLSLLIDFNGLPKDEIIKIRDELQSCLADIYKKAPLTDDKSYCLAKKSLNENESQFFTREELNKMLPAPLRKID